MKILELIVGIVMGLLALALIALVLLQQGRRAGINGVIAGGAETFLSKNKANTLDATLKRLTKIGVVAFMVLAVVATFIAVRIAA